MSWDAAVKYEFLLRINNAIVTKTTKESLFQALAEALEKYTHYDRLSIYVQDTEARYVRYFAEAKGVIPEGMERLRGRPLKQASIAQATIETGRPIIIDNLNDYSMFSTVPAMLKAGLTSTMAFPLKVRNRILGTMHLSFRKKSDQFHQLADILGDLSTQVAMAVDNMLAHTRLRELAENLESQKKYLQDQTNREYQEGKFVFASDAMVRVMEQVNMVAPTGASVFLLGETGTGKDLLARYIHASSPYQNNLFVKINCPALTPTLFESELFGHARGAFTNAHTNRVGRFEMARGGTVLLDEVSELPVNLQAKLLNVIQDRTFERVGDSRPIRVDFRLIATSNRNLSQAMEEGLFRRDLYYRLAMVPIYLPPLRERPRDIPLLIEHLTMVEANETRKPAPRFSPAAMERLCRYPWPGNVRELRNFVSRMFALMPGEVVHDFDLHTNVEHVPRPGIHGLESLAAAEKQIIEKALTETRGMVGGGKGAAALLGLPTSTLQYRIRKYEIDPKAFYRTT